MKHLTNRRDGHERALAVVCLCILIGVLVAGLWPFNPFPRNEVAWLANQNGLHFGPQGIVLSSTDFPRTDSSSAPACSIEVWLQPDKNQNSNDILTFYSPDAPQRLRLFQWRRSTLLLYRDLRSQHREIDVDNALLVGAPLLVTIAGGPDGTSLYLNGTLAERSSRLALSTNDCSGQLLLGTSPVTDSAWAGDIHGLAIYATELKAVQVRLHFAEWRDGGKPGVETSDAPVALYAFGERKGRVIHNQAGPGPDLYIPDSFLVPHKPLLLMPWKDIRWNRNSLEDIAINVCGFIPLGGFFCAYLSLKSKRAMLFTILAGTALSLIVEILQVYLPSRTSSLTDVTMNSVGVVLGILFFHFQTPAVRFAKHTH
jgi:VanZ family protein